MTTKTLSERTIQITDEAIQARDRAAMSDTSLHRAAAEAALEILTRQLAVETGDRPSRVNGQEIASIIYEKVRNAREL